MYGCIVISIFKFQKWIKISTPQVGCFSSFLRHGLVTMCTVSSGTIILPSICETRHQVVQDFMGQCNSSKPYICGKWSEGYASDKPLYQTNTLRVENKRRDSILTIKTKIKIGCQDYFCWNWRASRKSKYYQPPHPRQGWRVESQDKGYPTSRVWLTRS